MVNGRLVNPPVHFVASLVLVAACSSAVPAGTPALPFAPTPPAGTPALPFASTLPAATPARSLGHGERWVPVAIWTRGGLFFTCSGTGWVGGGSPLSGSPTDPRLVWTFRHGKRLELGWPVGYSARFTPNLELLDEQGNVVGREGDELIGGCETAEHGVWFVGLPTQ